MYLTQAIHRAAQQFPDSPALLGDTVVSHREFADRVASLAGGLRGLGVRDGDRVAILAPNCPEYLECVFAVAWAGGALVPLNTRWNAREIAYALTDSGTTAVLVHPMLRELVPDVAATVIGEPGYHALFADPVDDARRGGDELAGLWYTGGTSGRPKGVMLSHTNLITAALGWLAATPVPAATTRVLHAAPMFHIADFGMTVAHALRGGAHATLPRFDPAAVLDAVRRNEITDLLLVPVMIQRILDHDGDKSVPTLDSITYAGSPATTDTVLGARKQFPGVGLRHAYGMTEFAPGISVLAPEDNHGDRIRSAGRALPHVELRIADGDDNPVPQGTVGEIQLRGGSMMVGYWGRPAETATALRGGWMHTGDGGYVDPQGFLYIVDRLKDMIISGGENVYSTEVEDAVCTHPDVAAAAVIGVADRLLGERVHAVVVPRPGTAPTCDQLRAHVRPLIAGYKAPRSMELVDALPLTPAGKVRKAELRTARDGQ